MVTRRSGGFLVTGPSSVGAIATAILEFKVKLFTSGCGEERVWKLWPSMDPTLPAFIVYPASVIFHLLGGSGALDVAVGMRSRKP